MSFGPLQPTSRHVPGYSSSSRMSGGGIRTQSNAPSSRNTAASSTYGGTSSYGSSGAPRAGSRPAGTRSHHSPLISEYHHTSIQPLTSNGMYGSSGRDVSYGSRSTPTNRNMGGGASGGAPLESIRTSANNRSAAAPGGGSGYVEQFTFERAQTSAQDDYHYRGSSSAMNRQHTTPLEPSSSGGGHDYSSQLQNVFNGHQPHHQPPPAATSTSSRSSTPLLPATHNSSSSGGGGGTPRGSGGATATYRTSTTITQQRRDEEEGDYYGSSDAFLKKKRPSPPPNSSPTSAAPSASSSYAPQLRQRTTATAGTTSSNNSINGSGVAESQYDNKYSNNSYPPLPIPFGFRNLGNTCYLNATLQCILHTPGFVHAAEADPPRKSRAPMVDDMKELLGIPNSRLSTSTGPLLSSLKNKTSRINPEFNGFGQNDGHEFLRAILLGVHDEINRSRGAKYQEMKDIPEESDRDAAHRWGQYHKMHDDSAVYDMFGGQLRSVTKCGACQYRSLTFDPILDVSVPLTKDGGEVRRTSSSYLPSSGSSNSFRLFEMLQNFSQPDDLVGTNKFHCPRCKVPKEGKRQTTISTWPKNLVIHFKRFSQTGSKNGGRIEFKEKLEVPAIMAGISESVRGKPESAGLQPPDYRLRGVVIHHGTSSFGHYTSYIHNASKRGWFYCDDASVRSATIEEVLGETAGAYILFYEGVGPGSVSAGN